MIMLTTGDSRINGMTSTSDTVAGRKLYRYGSRCASTMD